MENRIVKPSPCDNCERASACSKTGCPRWEAWFKESWHTLRVLFLGEERANERGKSV
jgi:hypothetical protein